MGKDGKNSVRLTTTLSKKQLEQLERLARDNDVAVAWIARKAIVRFIEDAEGGPLLPLDNL